MNFFLSTLILSLILMGCSSQNAFTKFEMNKQQELSVSNSQTSKIKFEDKVDGIISAIYLNEVNPKSFSKNEYFYVSLYLKNRNKSYDIGSSLKLNEKLPIEIKKLSSDNQFSNLTSVNSEWNRYYLVAFKEADEENTTKLNLVFKHGEFSSSVMNYNKSKL